MTDRYFLLARLITVNVYSWFDCWVLPIKTAFAVKNNKPGQMGRKPGTLMALSDFVDSLHRAKVKVSQVIVQRRL